MRPRELVTVHPAKFAGKSSQEKINELRKELEKQKKAAFVICTVIPQSLSVTSAN